MTARTAPGGKTLAAAASRLATIQRQLDPGDIRRRLETAPPYTAYALAYLDARLFALADFFEAQVGDRWALVMHARGGLGPTTLIHGDVELAAAVLRLHPGPQQSFLTCSPDHVDNILITHNLWRPQTMLRLQLDRDDFAPTADLSSVRRLTEADAIELNYLYAIEGDGLHYSGRQVTEGAYFGAYVRGRLAAAAGTHIQSQRERVGVIGNVFTHPDFRGRGLGTAVTTAVAAHLMPRSDLIVLNVDPANRTARHIYETLGFKETGRLVEAMATRRDGLSARPLMRRLLARWRSRVAGVELVSF